MTTATDEARKLLEAKTAGDELAKHSYYELLRVAIGLAEALVTLRAYVEQLELLVYGSPDATEADHESVAPTNTALAAWEKLLGPANGGEEEG